VNSSVLVNAAVIPAPGIAPEVRQYGIPKLSTGECLVSIIASEVCGTDVHLFHGRLTGVPYPLIPGHVSVGRIEQTGGQLFYIDGTPVSTGDLVTFLDVYGTCGKCMYCSVWKASTRCPKRKVYGITVGAEEPPGLSGGWAEYILLRRGTMLLQLPADVSPASWIGAGCGLPTAVHAIELAQIKLGDRVLVQGSGPVGLNAALLALLSGAGWVGIIGSPRSRLEAAERFGTDLALDIASTSAESRVSAVRQATGGYGPDIVIEASGNPAAVPEGCELVRDNGRYVIVGQYTNNGDIAINPHLHINRKHLTIHGCWGSDFSHVYRAMEVLARFNRVHNWESFITKRYSLQHAAQALDDVEHQRVVKAVITPQGE
jgi:L-iditol 2-dehydrogenase